MEFNIFYVNQQAKFDLTSINGLLLLSSVTMLYIINVDKSQADYLNSIKDYYKNNLDIKINEIISSNRLGVTGELKESLKKLQVQSEETPFFHKKLDNLIIRKLLIFRISKHQHYITHFDVLIALIGLVILICALTYFLFCINYPDISLFKYKLYAVAALLLFIIPMVFTFSIGAYCQRCRFNEFRIDSEKKLPIIESLLNNNNN